VKYFIKEYETRFFAGIEFPNGIRLKSDDTKKIPELWEDFFSKYSDKIHNQKDPQHLVGLEIYPFDFQETKVFDYFVLTETQGLVEISDELITKKLKAGKYICFPIEFDRIREEISKVYNFIKANHIKVHMGFDYEDYLSDQNYGKAGAILNFCLLLENDIK